MENFKALGLSDRVTRALGEMGFETPTEIQEKTIPTLLSETTDFIGLAQTGTGKTAAFGLPLIELIEADNRNTQALILAPTRELAQQIAKQLEAFSSQTKSLNVVCVYGGAAISNQIREIKRGAQIVVATPGRLIDLAGRRAVNLGQIDYVVLDEADEMLNMGFKDELDKILEQTPEDKLTWLFSATMPAEIKRMVKNYMHEPVEVRINSGQKVNQNIEHQFAVLKASDKPEAIRRLLDFDSEIYGVVFCRTKRDTQQLADNLLQSGYMAEALHGDLSQSQRDAVMKRFRGKMIQLLIATDVAARGIDVDNLTHVIHHALPNDAEYYTHRSGRTARAGNKGISLSLITKGDMRKLKYLENKLGIDFKKALIPSASEVSQNRITHWATLIAQKEIARNANQEVFEVAESILGDLNKSELIQKLATIELEKVSSKKSLQDLNDKGGRDDSRNKRDRAERGDRDENMQRYFINLGQMDGFEKGSLLRYICDQSGINGSDIGRINLERKHAYVDIDASASAKVKQALDGTSYEGRELRINRDEQNPSRGKDKKGRNKKKPTSKQRKAKRRY